MSEFDGFKSAHFDAYEQRKWSMGRFNLERMRVREHAEGLGRALLGGLGERGLALRSSQDHPTIFNDKKVDAQWVVLGRADATRRPLKPLLVRERNLAHEAESALPQKQEAVLSLRVDVGGVEVALRLHRAAAMDRKNLATALAGDAVKTQFNTLLSGLPDGTVVQVGDVVVPASEANATAVADGLANGAEWLMVGRAYGRGEAVVGQADFVAEANRVIEALLPLYDLCAWSAHNDLIGGQALLETVAAAPVAAQQASGETGAESGYVSWMQILLRAGLVGWIIIGLSVAAVALTVEHLATIRRTVLIPPSLVRQADALMAAGQAVQLRELCGQQRSLLGRMLTAGLNEPGGARPGE